MQTNLVNFRICLNMKLLYENMLELIIVNKNLNSMDSMAMLLDLKA